jgi:RecB family exonuclease
MHKLQRFYPLKDALDDTGLPFEASDGWIQLGVGALEAYDKCPYDFFLQHVLGIREPFGAPMAFGSAMHQVIQFYNQGAMRGETVEIGELLARLEELWHNNGYESLKLAEADHERARQVVAWFYQREIELQLSAPEARRILGTEVKIILELPEAKLRLKGRIDAYYQTPDGIEIRDFKTGRGKTDPDKMVDATKKSFQLRTYALAYQMMNGVAPSRVTLDYVVTRTEGSAELSERILQNHRAKLASLAERIRLRDFAPAPPSQFHQCAATKFYGEVEEDSLAEGVTL